MPTKRELDSTAHTSSTEYNLVPNMDYGFTLSGSGTWQVWDGQTWKDYEESSGTSQAFVGTAPISGRVRLNVSSGTVYGGFKILHPNRKTRLGT